MAERLIQLTEKEERCRQLAVSVHHVCCSHDSGDGVLLVPDENEVRCLQRGEYIDQFLVIPGLMSADDGGAELADGLAWRACAIDFQVTAPRSVCVPESTASCE